MIANNPLMTIIASRIRFKPFLFACLLFVGCGSAWCEVVGRVAAANGSVSVTAVNGTARSLAVNDDINEGDAIDTSDQGWAVLRMVDGASFSIRPKSKMVIDKYVYKEDSDADDNAVINLMKGALRSISGLIGKRSAQRFHLHTPTATIGIRGTDHETVVVGEQDATRDAPAGTYESVNAGQTVLKGKQGEVSIEPGKVGYLHPSGTRQPSLLASKPRLFNRLRQFDQRQGINRVLGRLHKHVGNSAFDAPPNLKQRLKHEWPHKAKADGRSENNKGQKMRKTARGGNRKKK